MTFDYEKDTRQHYQSDAVAKSYHDEYVNRTGWSGLRYRFVARRERAAVRRLLLRIPHRAVVDIPTGTGKMAPVLAELGCKVTACDVSRNMLSIAQDSYGKAGCSSAEFAIVDLETAADTLTGTYDAVICVRLMHRVPDDVKRRMLRQISLLSPHAVISFGIESGYQRGRRFFRRMIFGGLDAGVETRGSMDSIRNMLAEDFDVLKIHPVAAAISAEWMFLLKSRNL